MNDKHKKSGKKFWATVLVTLAAVVALGWMLRQVDWQQALATWSKVPPYVWLLSALGLAASHLLRAGRVRAEWRSQLRMGWREAWGLMVRHSAWVVLVPMRGGEAIYVWALHRQGGVPLRQAGLSLLRLRLQDMAVLAVLALALFAPLAWPWRLLLLAAVLLEVALGVWTLLWAVPLWLGLAHQGGALLVLAAALWNLHRSLGGERVAAMHEVRA